MTLRERVALTGHVLTTRLVKRIFLFGLVAFTIGLSFYFLAIPVISRDVASGILEDLGFEDVELDVRAVSATGMYATNIHERSRQFHVGAIGIDYELKDLLAGRVDTVTLTGVEWEMSVVDGQIVIAPFDALPASKDSGPLDLPFRKVVLRSSSVALNWEGYMFRVPVRASITQNESKVLEVEMNLDILGSPLQIAGTLVPAKESEEQGEWAVDADLEYLKTHWRMNGNVTDEAIGIKLSLDDEQSVKKVAPNRTPATSSLHRSSLKPMASQSTGDWLSIQASFDRSARGNAIGLHVAGRSKLIQLGLLSDQLEAKDVSAHLSLTIEDDLSISEFNSGFEAGPTSWNELRLDAITMALDQEAGQLKAVGTATGKDGIWAMNMQTIAPQIDRLAEGFKGVEIKTEWKLSGQIPQTFTQQIKRFGITLTPHHNTEALFKGSLGIVFHDAGDAAGKNQSSPKLAWHAQAKNIELRTSKADIHWPSQDVELNGVSSNLILNASISDGRVHLTFDPASMVAFDEIAIGGSNEKTIVGKGAILFGPVGDEDVEGLPSQFVWSISSGLESGKLQLALKEAIAIDSDDLHAEIAGMSCRAVITGGNEGGQGNQELKPLQVVAKIHLDDTSIASRTQNMTIGKIRGTLPIVIGDSKVKPGMVHLGDIRFRNQEIAPIHGTVMFKNGHIVTSATWKPFNQSTFNMRGKVDLTGAASHGQFFIDAPLFAWTTADDEKLQKLFPSLGKYSLGGEIGIDKTSRIDFDDGRISPAVTINLKKFSLMNEEYDMDVNGVGGSVTIEGFSPLTTPGRQQLQVEELKIGKIELKDGLIAFRVESLDSIFIERTNWSWGDKGQFFVHAFRLQPSVLEYDMQIFVENLDLNDWIDVLTDKRVKGKGLLSGRLPIKIRPESKKRKVMIGRGFLYAQPQPGTLEVLDTALIRDLLIQSNAQFGTDEQLKEVMEQIVDAMGSFQYDRLSFDFIPRPEENDLQLRISTAGKGRDHDGKKGVPIENLTVNLNGIDKLINESLFWKRGSDDAIQNALEGFFKD